MILHKYKKALQPNIYNDYSIITYDETKISKYRDEQGKEIKTGSKSVLVSLPVCLYLSTLVTRTSPKMINDKNTNM